MGLFNSMQISATGLTAQRFRMDVISNNIANANTTRTTEGGPFKKQRVVLRPRNEQFKYKSPFLPHVLRNRVGEGVKVSRVERDDTQGRLVYDPEHPDAYQFGPSKGYVEYPNVDVVTEMVDMIDASRAYEANVNVMNSAKTMFNRALDIGVR